ncbi:34552_t:CDS:1, partial [Racocetra persica]
QQMTKTTIHQQNYKTIPIQNNDEIIKLPNSPLATRSKQQQ